MLINLCELSPLLTVREIATKIKTMCLFVRMRPKRTNFAGNRSFDVRVLLLFSICGTFHVLDPLRDSAGYKNKDNVHLCVWMCWMHMNYFARNRSFNVRVFVGNRSFNVRVLLCFLIYGNFLHFDPLENRE